MEENTTLETTAFDTPELDAIVFTTADETENTQTESFGKEIAKTLAISAAVTAGTMVGFATVGLAVGAVRDFRVRRAEKKEALRSIADEV